MRIYALKSDRKLYKKWKKHALKRNITSPDKVVKFRKFEKHKLVDGVGAVAVVAGLGGAVVDVRPAVSPREPRLALAQVVVLPVDAPDVVVARGGGAVVDVHLARLPSEPCKLFGCQGEINWLSGWKLNWVSV